MKNLKRNMGTLLLSIIVILHIIFIHLKISNVESKIPDNYISRIEYDLKDQMIRNNIRNINGEIIEIQRKIEKTKEVR